MLQAIDLMKKFEEQIALEKMNATIATGSVYGLIGSNGSGKSTFLRLASGVYRPDQGKILIDGEEVYENPKIKDRILFVADELYFHPQSSLQEMADFYRHLYSGWDQTVYEKLCEIFPISAKQKLNTFSKGMQRQAALVLALSCRSDYLLLDEAFDGLDPVIRTAVRKILADDIADRGSTVIITSHNLRELEDLCDYVGLLHQGRILFEKELDELKLGFCKVQVVFQPEIPIEQLKSLQVMQAERRGSLLSLIVRGTSSDVLDYLANFHPVFAESVPLTLEEIFIHEMEAVGYDHNKVIF